MLFNSLKHILSLNRIANIITNDLSVPMKNEPKLVLHIVPYNALESGEKYDVVSLGNNPGNLRPIGASGWDTRYNFDGIISYAAFPNENTVYSYVQIFHNGILEIVDGRISTSRDQVRYLYHNNERELTNSIPPFVAVLKHLGVQPPLFFLLSLVGVKNCRIEKIPNMGLGHVTDHPIDRNELIIPEILVDSFEADIDACMQPAFDMMWNAAGFPKSIYRLRLGA